MRIKLKNLCLGAVVTAGLFIPALATSPTSPEFARSRAWLDEQFRPARGSARSPSEPAGWRGASATPFSFIYDGRSSDELLPGWRFKETTKKLDSFRTQRTQVYMDARTGLELRVVIIAFADFPTVEWTLYFKNAGASDTPLLEHIQALDTVIERSGASEFKLHHFTGALAREEDYQPWETKLGPEIKKRFAGAGGRPTNDYMCYFNLELADSQGLIIALGWPGQWAADFVRDSGARLRLTCGQELTHLRLRPGEEIRTPLVALQFWQGGDWIRAQNTWRRWMIAHNMPHPGGKPVVPQYGGCFGNIRCSAAEEIAEMDGYFRDGIKLDHWIIDAGWYPMDGTAWWVIGNWAVDRSRFPNGLREVADHVHERGMDFIVWFEPERVSSRSWLARTHPDWILKGRGDNLLNLGNPEAWKWVVNYIDVMLWTGGIDHLRSDFNMDPLDNWRGNDAADRQGITENLYVQGFLAFWDELLRRHPKMYIDTCASGGRRNDLETLRRSVPLLRSDYPLSDFSIKTAHGQQCQTYGISFWIPYHGTGAPNSDPYTLRSSYCPAYRIGYNALDPKRNIQLMQRSVGEIRQILPYLVADFYPLTAYSREKKVWIAWQYDSPEAGGGVVQAFRREESGEVMMTFKLRGLEPDSFYLVTNLDDSATRRITGQALMNEGLNVSLPAKPGSAVIIYKKAG